MMILSKQNIKNNKVGKDKSIKKSLFLLKFIIKKKEKSKQQSENISIFTPVNENAMFRLLRWHQKFLIKIKITKLNRKKRTPFL